MASTYLLPSVVVRVARRSPQNGASRLGKLHSKKSMPCSSPEMPSVMKWLVMLNAFRPKQRPQGKGGGGRG